MKKLFISLTVAVTLCAVLVFNIITTSAAYQLDSNINKIMESVEIAIKDNPALGFSSNPYDFIVYNKDYKAIINQGSEVLPIIEEKINKSEKSGLKEYILAAAAEEISKVDLKGDNYGWRDGKGWAGVWDKHLKNLTKNIDNIISSNDSTEIKIKKLTKLGTPAIPFIMDKIEQGNTELEPVLENLLSGNSKVSFDKNSTKDIKVWINSNKDKFSDLRDLVSKR